MTTMTRRWLALLVCLMCLPATGCAVGLADLPLPAPGAAGDSYELTADFANALNLPTKAKVRVNGVDVGVVETMTAHDYVAVVTMKIRNGTRLPQGTRAELRSATPLGDVFVALDVPDSAGPDTPMLGDGDTIPVRQTSSAATVEEVLSTAAMLVNGGAIRDLTNLVNGLGSAVGDHGDELGALISQSNELVASLSRRSAQITSVLRSADDMSRLIASRQQTIDAALAAAGPALRVLSDSTQSILGTVDQITAITRQLQRFPSINGTGAGGMLADINEVAASLNAAAQAPGASTAAVNRMLGPVIKITNATSAHVDVDLVKFSLGVADDPNQLADPGTRVPDGTDWERFVGSLTLTILKLRDKVAPR